jgi:hypothetical protein
VIDLRAHSVSRRLGRAVAGYPSFRGRVAEQAAQPIGEHRALLDSGEPSFSISLVESIVGSTGEDMNVEVPDVLSAAWLVVLTH